MLDTDDLSCNYLTTNDLEGILCYHQVNMKAGELPHINYKAGDRIKLIVEDERSKLKAVNINKLKEHYRGAVVFVKLNPIDQGATRIAVQAEKVDDNTLLETYVNQIQTNLDKERLLSEGRELLNGSV